MAKHITPAEAAKLAGVTAQQIGWVCKFFGISESVRNSHKVIDEEAFKKVLEFRESLNHDPNARRTTGRKRPPSLLKYKFW